MINVLMREVPASFLAGVASGEYRVGGSVIQSVASGRIVGHLQETAGLTSLLGSGSLAPLELATQAVSVIQNEQIKTAVAVVHSLQFANLALTGAAIGVSIAGTAILAARIGRVEEKTEAVLHGLSKLDRAIDALRHERIVEDFTRLRTLADQIDDAWSPSASRQEWIDIAREAHFLEGSFERRAHELVEHSDPLPAEPFAEAFALASGIRVTARLGAGQDDMALKAATSRSEALTSLAGPLQLGQLVLNAMAADEDAGTARWQEHLDTTAAEIRSTVEAVRARELAAAATVDTLEELARQKISGRDWLLASRSEQDSPVMFLPVTEARD